MTISEREYMDYLDIIDSLEPEILEESFSRIVKKTTCKFHIPKTILVFIETFLPYWDDRTDTLDFDTDDVTLYVQWEDGKTEILDIE